ncbi:hypothetical protein BaRGS_00030663, partial [Batillaria attramentaria]
RTGHIIRSDCTKLTSRPIDHNWPKNYFQKPGRRCYVTRGLTYFRLGRDPDLPDRQVRDWTRVVPRVGGTGKVRERRQ